MTRIAMCLAVLAAGCGGSSYLPVQSEAPGTKRLPVVALAKPDGPPVKTRHHRRSRPRVSRSSQRAAGSRLVTTMYCYTGSRNAAGKWPTVGTAAANAYPLGTRLRVEGVGVVTVEDRSAPGATDIDLYGGSDAGCEARAVQWGRRLLLVSEVR